MTNAIKLLVIIIASLHLLDATLTVDPNSLTNLKYYEFLKPHNLKHKIAKRSAISTEQSKEDDSVKEMSFNAMGRQFNLVLKPNPNLFSSEFKTFTVDAFGVKKPMHVDFNQFYHGEVTGSDNSMVSAHFDGQLLTASIHTGDNVYVIEPSWRVFHNTSDNNTMVIYNTKDYRNEEKPSKFCDYIKIEENRSDTDYELQQNIRKKRSIIIENEIPDDYFVPSATHCALLLVADYSFYSSMGAFSKQTTVNYLIHIIDRVNRIFNQTEWKDEDHQTGFKGMGFLIKEILIHTDQGKYEWDYNYDKKWTVRDMLEAFSKNRANNDFCLAHLFTHRTFENSVLGLAYVASPRTNSYGGICSPSYEKSGDILYLNTGLTTTRDKFGKRIITRQSVLVTAHEFAHNWGSEHDPDTKECSPPAKEGGSYVMYTYSVSGFDKNNKFFSPCSKRSIRSVLIEKSSRCFSKPDKAYCGNSKVEEGEECDEGLIATDGENYPQGICCDQYCKLRTGSDCSDKNSPCCEGCKITKLGKTCKGKDDLNCKNESLCDGMSTECPEPPPAVDGTSCLDNGTCRNGNCVSFCQAREQQSCMCDKIEYACFRCCMNSNGTCAPSFPRKILEDGTPCHFGFCEKGRCEKQVQDPIERFWDVIEEITINSFFKFMKDNIVGAVVVFSFILWIPAVGIINFFDNKLKKKCQENLETNKRNLIDSWPRQNRKNFSSHSFRFDKKPVIYNRSASSTSSPANVGCVQSDDRSKGRKVVFRSPIYRTN